jgi:hypothetical protein
VIHNQQCICGENIKKTSLSLNSVIELFMQFGMDSKALRTQHSQQSRNGVGLATDVRVHVLCPGVPPVADVWCLAGLHQPGAGAGAAAGRLLTSRQHRHGLLAPRVLGRHQQGQQQVLHNAHTALTQKSPSWALFPEVHKFENLYFLLTFILRDYTENKFMFILVNKSLGGKKTWRNSL